MFNNSLFLSVNIKMNVNNETDAFDQHPATVT